MSRLALVSKVLWNRELIELRQENTKQSREIEYLKLELFWREYNIPTLNRKIGSVRQFCRIRSVSGGPFPGETIFNQREWGLWIEPVMREFGLVYQITDDDQSDVHIICNANRDVTSLGAKLLKATSVDDPEVQKLKAFYDELLVIADCYGHSSKGGLVDSTSVFYRLVCPNGVRLRQCDRYPKQR